MGIKSSLVTDTQMSVLCQSCRTLPDPVDCSPPGSSVQGLFQARILEQIAISLPGDLPNSGVKPTSPALQADSLPFEPQGSASWFINNVIDFYFFIFPLSTGSLIR